MGRVHRRYTRCSRIQRIDDILIVADRVIYTRGSQDTVVEDIRLTATDVLIQMNVQRVRIFDGPFDDTVACKCTIIVDHGAMLHILPTRDGRNRVVVLARRLVPCIFMRPEELNRVALTQAVLILRNVCLVRTNDDMMVITTVAVIYDRIFVVWYTMPFALPFTAVLASFTMLEPRIDGVAQPDEATIDEEVLTNKGGVRLFQVRNDTECQMNGGVTTASRRVGVRMCYALSPDGIRILLT